ncbi:pimeloyl-ACP methyl ester carboxylesterase [Pseudomonas tolaasii]
MDCVSSHETDGHFRDKTSAIAPRPPCYCRPERAWEKNFSVFRTLLHTISTPSCSLNQPSLQYSTASSYNQSLSVQMMKKTLIVRCMCVALFMAVGACATKPQSRLGVKWKPDCEGRSIPKLPLEFSARIQCGIVTVPLDHFDPARGTLDLDITRIEALQPKKREGAIFTNDGEPGDDASWGAVYLAWVWTPDAEETRTEGYRHLANHYDVIGITLRGAGSTPSSQLVCQSSEVIVAQNDITEDRSPANIKAIQHNVGVLARGCASQPLAPYINTEQAARDMEFVRIHLKEEKVNYLGYSYGAWLGAWYAGLFPESVGRMVLDSGMHWTSTFQNASLAQAPEKERIFARFVENVTAANPHAYKMVDDPESIREIFQGLLPEVKVALRSITDEFSYAYYLMAAKALSDWSRNSADLSDAQLQAKAKAYRFSPDANTEKAAQLAFTHLLHIVRNPAPWNDIAPGALKLTAQQSVRSTLICNDSASSGDAFWIEKENQYATQYPVGGSFFPARHCAGWPAKQLTGVPQRNLAQVDSILMIQAEYDDRSPAASTIAAFQSLPNTYLAVFKDVYRHEISFSSDNNSCMNDKVVDYLAYGRKPERISTCTASSDSQ